MEDASSVKSKSNVKEDGNIRNILKKIPAKVNQLPCRYGSGKLDVGDPIKIAGKSTPMEDASSVKSKSNVKEDSNIRNILKKIPAKVNQLPCRYGSESESDPDNFYNIPLRRARGKPEVGDPIKIGGKSTSMEDASSVKSESNVKEDGNIRNILKKTPAKVNLLPCRYGSGKPKVEELKKISGKSASMEDDYKKFDLCHNEDDKLNTDEEYDNEYNYSEEYSLSDDDGDDEDVEPMTNEVYSNKEDCNSRDDVMAAVEPENDGDGRKERNITVKDGEPPEAIILHNQLSAETGKRAAPTSTSKTPAEKKAKMMDFEPGPPPADTRDDQGDHSDDRNPAAHPDQLHSMIVVNPPPESTQGEDPTTIDGAVALRDVDPTESTLLEFSIKMKKEWITMQDVLPVLKTVLGAYEAPYSTIRKRTGQVIQGCLHILKQSQHLEMSEALASRTALVAARDAAINERNAAITARDEASVAGDSAKERLKEAEESINQLKKKEVELRHVVKFCRDEEAEAKTRAKEMLAVLKSRDDKIAQLEENSAADMEMVAECAKNLKLAMEELSASEF